MSSEPVTILGAAGPTGQHLAHLLLKRGRRVRVVGRSEKHLLSVFKDAGAEIVTADLMDPEAAARVLEDSPLAFVCVGLPLSDIAAYPMIIRAIARAAGRTGTRLVHVSNYWSYFPIDPEVERLTEDHPRTGGPLIAQARREAEDVLQAAGACVAQLSDFYGPGVGESIVQTALRDSRRPGGLSWMGTPLIERECCYVPDAMRIVADLADRPEAFGERWLIPGNGPASGRDLARMCEQRYRRGVAVKAAGPTTLWFLALFTRDLRDFLPLVPHYIEPLAFDTGKLTGLLGEQEDLTPFREAVWATLDWILSGETEAADDPALDGR